MKTLRIVIIALLLGCFSVSCATQSEMKSGNDQDDVYNQYKKRDMPPAWGGSYGGK
jgi:hypothetical protein